MDFLRTTVHLHPSDRTSVPPGSYICTPRIVHLYPQNRTSAPLRTSYMQECRRTGITRKSRRSKRGGNPAANFPAFGNRSVRSLLRSIALASGFGTSAVRCRPGCAFASESDSANSRDLSTGRFALSGEFSYVSVLTSISNMSEVSRGTTIAPFVGALELTASELPELLPWLIDVVQNSPARWMIHQLEETWGVRSVVDLGSGVLKAVRDLDRLEARPGHWRHARHIVHDPCLAALHDIAVKRHSRIDARARRNRLKAIVRRVAADLETERRCVRIQQFIGVAPVSHRSKSKTERRG